MITKGLCLKCTVCGAESSQNMSTGFDFATKTDLDQRPRPHMEGELEYRVMRCPSCGYCATNISTDAGVTREMIDDPDYHSIIESGDDPVYSSFMAKGYLMERTCYYIGAFDAYRSASWVADDLGEAELARRARVKAVETGRVFAEKMHPAGKCGFCDILRRAGRFEDCIRLADEVLASDSATDDDRSAAEYEKELCSQMNISNPIILEYSSKV